MVFFLPPFPIVSAGNSGAPLAWYVVDKLLAACCFGVDILGGSRVAVGISETLAHSAPTDRSRAYPNVGDNLSIVKKLYAHIAIVVHELSTTHVLSFRGPVSLTHRKIAALLQLLLFIIKKRIGSVMKIDLIDVKRIIQRKRHTSRMMSSFKDWMRHLIQFAIAAQASKERVCRGELNFEVVK